MTRKIFSFHYNAHTTQSVEDGSRYIHLLIEEIFFFIFFFPHHHSSCLSLKKYLLVLSCVPDNVSLGIYNVKQKPEKPVFKHSLNSWGRHCAIAGEYKVMSDMDPILLNRIARLNTDSLVKPEFHTNNEYIF